MLARTLTLFLSAALIYNASPCCAAQEPPVTVDFEAFQASKYVWRGLVFNDEPVVQPSITVSAPSGVSLNLWGSIDQTDSCDLRGRCSELDYTLAYDFISGGRDWSVGYAVYTYPNTGFAGTGEILVSCAFGGSWDTKLSLSRDVREANGLYLNLGWARTALVAGRSVDISGGIGFADKKASGYYSGVAVGGLSDASLCLEAPIDFHAGWSVTPSIAYTRMLKQSVREVVERPDNFVFGLRLARTF